jgi:CheY-like chemotaxis protein
MADPRSAAVLSALRAAIEPEQGRHLVAVGDPVERSRIVTALAPEGQVVLEASPRFALDRLDAELFALAVLDATEALYPLVDLKEARPHTDLLLLIDPDPVRCGEVYAADLEAVLPRPLPQAEILLHGHFRWLASCRRLRTAWLRLRQAIARLGPELSRCEPDLARALAEVCDTPAQEPSVLMMGDDSVAGAAGGRPVQADADVVVLALAAADSVPASLQEAWTRAPQAAVVVLDAAPSPARLAAAVYGGARAYLLRSQRDELAQVVANIAARQRAEIGGRRLGETLTRHARGNGVSVAADPQPADVSVGSSAPFVPSGHEVLLVDGEAVVLTVVREALRRVGYRVTTAASGPEAIDLLRRRPFDLLLTARDLPGVSGLEVGRVARAHSSPPAVILMTAQGSYEAAAEALDIGAYDYLEKPITDLENLRARVRRALSRHDQQRSRPPAPAEMPADRVLLVEAEGGRRRLMAEFLGRFYRVAAVADGAEAQRLLEKERFDVVLADRNLPGLSGLRVIEQAQRLLPHCACVLYTAYPSSETVKEALELGVDAFCVRPNEDLKSLGQKVAEALRSRGGILLG